MKKIVFLLTAFCIYAQVISNKKGIQILKDQCRALFSKNIYNTKEDYLTFVSHKNDDIVCTDVKNIINAANELKISLSNLANVRIPFYNDKLSMVDIAVVSGWQNTTDNLINSGFDSYDISRIFSFCSKINFESEQVIDTYITQCNDNYAYKNNDFSGLYRHNFWSEMCKQGVSQINALSKLKDNQENDCGADYIASLAFLQQKYDVIVKNNCADDNGSMQADKSIEDSIMDLIKKFHISNKSLSNSYQLSLPYPNDLKLNILAWAICKGKVKLTTDLLGYGLDPSNTNDQQKSVEELFPKNAVYTKNQLEAMIEVLKALDLNSNNSSRK